MWPIRPDFVRPVRIDGKLVFVVNVPGQEKARTVDPDDMIHVPGLSYDGLVGKSPIRLHMEAIGLSLAQEAYASKFFGNGAVPDLAVKYPTKLSESAIDEIRRSWNGKYQGVGNSHRTAILEEGLSIEKIGVPPEQSQFIQGRTFQTDEIARIYRMPPHKIGEMSKSSFNNIVQMDLSYVKETITPHVVGLEEAFDYKLFITAAQRQKYYTKFNLAALLRGDPETRSKFYQTMWGIGSISQNEIRDFEDWNEVDGGDEYYVPLNFIPASIATQPTPALSESNSSNPIKEIRVSKAIQQTLVSRNRMRRQYLGLFDDAATSIVSREGSVIKRNAKKLLTGNGTGDFKDWLDEYYENNMPTFIKNKMTPVVTSYNSAVRGEISKETGQDEDDMISTDTQSDDYVDGYAAKHIDSSVGQITALLEDEDEALGLVDDRVDEWLVRRPAKIARNETVRAEGALAGAIIYSQGNKTVVVNQGESTCPYCQTLSGKVSSESSFILNKGDTIEPDGEDVMEVFESKRHSPFHQGCDCIMMSI